MNLHDAILKVLEEKDGQTPKQIASKINSAQYYTRKDGQPLERNQISARINKYLHLFEKKGTKIFIKKSISTNKTSRAKSKTISETKCTCKSCQYFWFYGKSDEMESLANHHSELGKSMLCCSGCLPALFIPDKKIIDLDKCPKCGSRSVEKQTITHNV